MQNTRDKKIVVIGGGIAGLTAGYLLQQKHDVVLFEKSDRVGGNAYSLTTPDGQDMDIAAAVFGRSSYKNLFRLFNRLTIKTAGPFRMSLCDMTGLGVSFHDLETRTGLYLTPGIKGLFAQRFDIVRPERVKSVLQFMRGLRKARSFLRHGELKGLTVDEALKKIPELTGDAKLIFLCCLCLISSMHCNAVLDAPAAFFIEKLNVYHDFLPPKAFFCVQFARKGTKSYVNALAAPFQEKILLNARIRTIRRQENRVIVVMEDNREIAFDSVVFGCNADQALGMLEEPTAEEKRLLGAWKYTEGRVVVHRDHSHFPKRSLMEGYTFLYRATGNSIETSVTGSPWVLPNVSRKSEFLSTQHPNFPIRKDLVLFEKVFRTPIFDFNSCESVRELPSLNGVRNTYYCGSHFGFGLHEDAVTSAIGVARQLGVEF